MGGWLATPSTLLASGSSFLGAVKRRAPTPVLSIVPFYALPEAKIYVQLKRPRSLAAGHPVCLLDIWNLQKKGRVAPWVAAILVPYIVLTREKKNPLPFFCPESTNGPMFNSWPLHLKGSPVEGDVKAFSRRPWNTTIRLLLHDWFNPS